MLTPDLSEWVTSGGGAMRSLAERGNMGSVEFSCLLNIRGRGCLTVEASIQVLYKVAKHLQMLQLRLSSPVTRDMEACRSRLHPLNALLSLISERQIS